MTDAPKFERDTWLICQRTPTKRAVAGVIGMYNGRRVVSIRCESQGCRHIYDTDGRSKDAILFHLWDVETGECIHTEHMLKDRSRTGLDTPPKGSNHG